MSDIDEVRKFYRTGERAPVNGIYRVHHDEHRLSHEVTVLRGAIFPACSRCANKVQFELVRTASSDDEFRVVLNSLPVIDDDDTTTGREHPLAS
ncbi:MAG TPA: hypothetical protein VE998_13235 [Terriglobales bacterium]|nr:hypothetical protein [Terriglobales bacterium]